MFLVPGGAPGKEASLRPPAPRDTGSAGTSVLFVGWQSCSKAEPRVKDGLCTQTLFFFSLKRTKEKEEEISWMYKQQVGKKFRKFQKLWERVKMRKPQEARDLGLRLDGACCPG